ncbi:hypothetical protein GID46_17315 [Salmonella enterica]|nr:hypothetical protein [Salmonella enterica]
MSGWSVVALAGWLAGFGWRRMWWLCLAASPCSSDFAGFRQIPLKD